MIDPNLFTVETLLAAMLDDHHGNVNPWRKHAEIITAYMPPYPDATTRPKCVVRVGAEFLRYSHGPAQGYCWDIIGDDFMSPAIALLALCRAPVPPSLLQRDTPLKTEVIDWLNAQSKEVRRSSTFMGDHADVKAAALREAAEHIREKL